MDTISTAAPSSPNEEILAQTRLKLFGSDVLANHKGIGPRWLAYGGMVFVYCLCQSAGWWLLMNLQAWEFVPASGKLPNAVQVSILDSLIDQSWIFLAFVFGILAFVSAMASIVTGFLVNPFISEKGAMLCCLVPATVTALIFLASGIAAGSFFTGIAIAAAYWMITLYGASQAIEES